MSISQHLSRSCAVLFCLSFLVLAPVVHAQVSVGCAGAGGPSDFPSIGAALAANPAGNVSITISGVCTEAVFLAGMQNVQLNGTPGAALVDPGENPPSYGAVLDIEDSHNITVQGLTIQVASRSVDSAIPVMTVGNSDVFVRASNIEGAGASDGIDAFQSTVRIFGATVIENNNDGQGSGEGIFVQGPSSTLSLRRDGSGNCPVIQNSGDSGIFISGSGAHLGVPAPAGCAKIQNNSIGIFANQGATVNLSASQSSQNSIQVLNNQLGVIAVVGAQFNISGPVLIQGNSFAGVRVRNAQGALGAAPDGPAGPLIQQNGTAGFSFVDTNFCCVVPAGVSVVNNGDLDITAATVVNNSAPGVVISDNSSTRLIGSLGTINISQNPTGVSVTNVSSLALFLSPTITGNSGSDVSCGPDSVAYGDLSGVGKTSCQQFKTVNTPAPHKHAASRNSRPQP